MARETKFGFLFVLVLASAFGLLVYKRMHQPLALMAESEATAVDDETLEETPGLDVPVRDVTATDSDQPSLQVPAAEPIPRPVSPTSPSTPTISKTPLPAAIADRQPTSTTTTLASTGPTSRPAVPVDLDDDFFAAPVGQKPAAVAQTTTSPTTPKTATIPTDLDDDFPTAQPSAEPVQPVTEAAADPFGFSAPAEPAPAMTATPAATANTPANEPFDPFADGPAVDGPPSKPNTPAAPAGSEVSAQTVPAATPLAAAKTESTDDPFFTNGNSPDPVAPAKEMPAMAAPAATPVADPFDTPEPVATKSPTTVPVVVTTPQPEDFFDAPSQPQPTTPVSPKLPTAEPEDPLVAAPQPQPSLTVEAVPIPESPAMAAPESAAPEQKSPVAEADPFDAPVALPTTVKTPQTSPAIAATPEPSSGFTAEELGGFRPVRVSDSEASSTTVIQRQPAMTAEPDPFEATPRTTTQPETVGALAPNAELKSPAPATQFAGDVAYFPDGPTSRSAAPATLSGESYVVQPSDSFWTISKRVYGTGRYFRALAKHNESLIGDADQLRPKMTIATPPAADLDRLYRAEIPLAASSAVQLVKEENPERYQPDAEPGFFVHASGQPMYRVGSNDTLSDISFNHLGRASRWIQIFEMNRDILKDGNILSVGTVLKLPGDASQVRVVGFESSDR